MAGKGRSTRSTGRTAPAGRDAKRAADPPVDELEDHDVDQGGCETVERGGHRLVDGLGWVPEEG